MCIDLNEMAEELRKRNESKNQKVSNQTDL